MSSTTRVSSLYAVRFSRARRLRRARLPEPVAARSGRLCAVSSPWGERLGELLWPLPEELAEETSARLIHGEEAAQAANLPGLEAEALELARAVVKEAGAMPVILAAELDFAGEKLELHFRSEGAADLPALTQSIINRRGGAVLWQQHGRRGQARLCGGVGVCGLEFCCSSFLRSMPPVTLRMAQLQARSLAPEDTAGACGRLKCCLRYELDPEETGEVLLGLRRGMMVEGRRGRGTIIALDPVERSVIVDTESGPRELFARELRPVSEEGTK